LLISSATPAGGIELADGTTAFTQSPRLLSAVTTFSAVRVWSAKYYFTVELPGGAGERLGKLSFQQKSSPETIRFKLDKTFAFAGTPDNRGESITVKETLLNQEDGTITVIFAPPVSAGKTLTVGLKPIKNPTYGGVYLFGVTAFPEGEKPAGMYLGVGRLHFYSNGDLHR
jgi:hypothetical protein